MKKTIAMSIAAALVTTAIANADEVTASQTPETTAAEATAPVNAELVKKVEKLEKSLKRLKKELTKVKTHDATDNIKWNVDFRTALDVINYKAASGKEYKNDSLLSNRLWLNMAFAPSANMIFKGQLAFNKAYGATPVNPSTGYPQRGFGYDTFDWVLNENLLDDTLRVKEAYWLYMSDSLFGTKVNWTASFGRRPSTDGFLISLREGDKPKSPLGHAINVEFDGASFKFGLEKVTDISGMSLKFCFGRGLTNARSRFNFDGGLASKGDYSKDRTTLKNVDLAGFIFVPYDDGQYKIMTTAYRGFNVPGFTMANGTVVGNDDGTMGIDGGDGMVGAIKPVFDQTGTFLGAQAAGLNPRVTMHNMGDMDGAAISFLMDGIGDGINDFLDNTKFFASVAWSVSHPDNKIEGLDLSAFNGFIGKKPWEIAGDINQMMSTNLSTNPQDYADPQSPASQQLAGAMIQAANGAPKVKEGMLGSNDDKTGVSYWVGVNMPAVVTDDGTFGLEYNHGTKYWRPFTYAEDTMIGSKMAVRGDAYEAYYIQPLMKGFSAEVRYTYFDYKYTGSQGFFGAGGTPMTMDEARAMGMDPIDKADDLRISLRYQF